MKRRRKMVIALAVVAVGLAVWAEMDRVRRANGPVYEGRSLREWVVEYEGLGRNARVPDARATLAEVEAAQGAFAAMGTNAWPYLVRWMRYEGPGPIRAKLMAWLSRFPRLVVWLGGTRGWEFSAASAAALAHGGPAMYGAREALKGLAREHRSPLSAGEAMGVLRHWMDSMDEGRFEYAADLVGDAEPALRRMGVFGLCAEASDSRLERSEPAVRMLVKLASAESDAATRGIAVDGIGRCRSCGLVAERVSALAVAAGDEDVGVMRTAAQALAGFGSKAVPALPALTNCLQANNGAIRMAAQAAIGTITAAAERGKERPAHE